MGKLTEVWHRLVKGKPGRRFVDFHAHRSKRRRGNGWALSRVLTLASGAVLVVGGLAVGWLPGPGGVVAILGAALLASEWRALAKVLDWSEIKLRSAWRRLRT